METPIKQWNEDDRPREKMFRSGAAALSDSELIAILLRTGTRTASALSLAREALQKAGNNLHSLSRLTPAEIQSLCNGIGEAKAAAIAAAMELGRRAEKCEEVKTETISCASQIADLFRPIIAHLPTEEFWLLALNNAGKEIDKFRLSTGGLTSTTVDVRTGLRLALMCRATAIAVVHNHPSGICRPSSGDIRVTRQFKESAAVMDIRFLDHVIICGKTDYFSFASENLM